MSLYRLAWPLLRRLDPERAHALAVAALERGLAPGGGGGDESVLATRLWGLDFPNPVGLAAGFDKNARVADAMLARGFGFVEVGSVTPRPQAGNPRPRLFRLEADRAVVNRMGFNNQGATQVAARLARRKGRPGVVGVNLGKNKDTEDAAADYEQGVSLLAPYADYLVINVSSPNTPGLRALQGREPLAEIVGRTRAALQRTCPAPVPLLLKIAPDLTDQDKADIAAVAEDGGLDGLICTNTTVTRPESLASAAARETGGLSGAPLAGPALSVLREMRALTGGRVPLVGVGGIASGADAYARIRAGASLVQLYSALVFEGPALVGRIKSELAALLRADGFASVADAVGVDA